VGAAVSAAYSEGIAHWLRDQSFKVTPGRIVLAVALLALAGAVGAGLSRTRPGRRVVRASAAAGQSAGALLSRVPPAVVLTAIVTVAAVARIALGTVEQLPRVFPDELIYSGLAKGIALDGVPSLRGETTTGYSILVPLAWSPGYALASTGADGFAFLKAVNAVAFASAAVPTYLFGRRIMTSGWSLAAAAAAAAAPWGAYAALAMTESLFYLGVAVFVLVLAWSLEAPAGRRQLSVLAVLAVLILVRPQAIVLVGATLAAYAAMAALTGRLRALLTTYWVTLVVVGVAAAIVAAGALAGVALPGRAYSPLLGAGWNILASVKWAAWNLGAIAASFGVVALVVFPVALRRLLGRSRTTAERAAGVAALTTSLAVLLTVAALSASPYGLNVLHERNLFYVAPVVLVCFFWWLSSAEARMSMLAVASGVAFVVLVLLVPDDLVQRSSRIDSPTALMLREVSGVVDGPPTWWLAAAAALAAVAVVAVRSVVVPIAALAVGFVAVTAQLDFEARLEGGAGSLDWIDRALPQPYRATLLNVGVRPAAGACVAAADHEQQELVVWTEFLNTRVDRVLRLFPLDAHDNLATPALSVGDGGVLLQDGKPVQADFVVADSRRPVVGSPLARFDLRAHWAGAQGASLTLWAVDDPLRLARVPRPLPQRPDGTDCRAR
jgi:hypothetical protein